ncbi:MAG TPA: hypothetical protein VH186_11830 [Chloroflexia bacterium]|nr:hypothetical protein [Chloroflexia bacterium]
MTKKAFNTVSLLNRVGFFTTFSGTAATSGEKLIRKVPEVTVLFWVIKLLSTGMGETTSDFLVKEINPIIGVMLGGAGFVAALVLQLAVRRYIPWVYWLAVVMVAIFGTMVADVIHVELGIPYLISTGGFLVALAVIFLTWYRTEKTLSIHSIYTFRRELFYWATVCATFALGTAAGDMTATTLGLGYLDSGILFAVIIAIPALGYFFFGLNEIIAFWFAYIITRPLGASFADWMGRATDLGGLGWGTGQVSLVLAVIIAMLVGYLSVSQKDF